jgi:hypothetical protein
MSASLRFPFLRFVPAAALAGAALLCQAQAGFDPDLHQLQVQLDAQKHLAAQWEAKGDVQFALVMLVGVLGALVAVLQSNVANKWCSRAVVLCGIVVSVATFGTKEYFDVDHKAYRRSAEKASYQIGTAEQYLQSIKSASIEPHDRQALIALVLQIISSVDAIAENIRGSASSGGSSPGAAALFGLIGTAHAQPVAAPAWANVARTESATAYRFVGSGMGVGVAACQDQARQAAQNAAATGLSLPIEAVRRYAVPLTSHVAAVGGQRSYRCYAQLELNKAVDRR